jgi:hypothetical protein
MKPHTSVKDKRPQPLQTPDNKSSVEDERGWAGQHGQHPAYEEEKNYRPVHKTPDQKKLDVR